MSPDTKPITRDDIEAKFRELTGEATGELESARSQAVTVGLAVGSQLPRKEGVSFFADTKVLWSALLWLVYLEALVAHKFFGRSARRFAVVVIIAFVFLLLTFGLTNRFSPLHQNPPTTTNGLVTTSWTCRVPAAPFSR